MAKAKEVSIAPDGSARFIKRDFNPDAGHGSGLDFSRGLNAGEVDDLMQDKSMDILKEKIAVFVRERIDAWGLIKLIERRGEMASAYRAKRFRETTGPGRKQVSMKQIEFEMDQVPVLFMSNSLERPDRSQYLNSKDFEKEVRSRTVRIELPGMTGQTRVHIKPSAGLSFTLRAEEFVRRDFNDVRYEVYDSNNSRHVTSKRNFSVAQDGRSMGDEKSAVIFQEVSGEIGDEVVGDEGIDISEYDTLPPEIDTEPEPEVESVPGTSTLYVENEDAFLQIWDRQHSTSPEKVDDLLNEFGMTRGTYYKLRTEHIARMESEDEQKSSGN